MAAEAEKTRKLDFEEIQIPTGPRLGSVVVEVDHLEHDEAARRELSGIARELGLVITGSSDHHGLGKADNKLACETTTPEQFEQLQSLWTTAAVNA